MYSYEFGDMVVYSSGDPDHQKREEEAQYPKLQNKGAL
jgi:hypothetical protein